MVGLFNFSPTQDEKAGTKKCSSIFRYLLLTNNPVKCSTILYIMHECGGGALVAACVVLHTVGEG
jgi:hypothetical protein